jgi:hypothetical protein
MGQQASASSLRQEDAVPWEDAPSTAGTAYRSCAQEKPADCGPAATATVLALYGKGEKPLDVVRRWFKDSELGTRPTHHGAPDFGQYGSYFDAICAVLAKNGVSSNASWNLSPATTLLKIRNASKVRPVILFVREYGPGATPLAKPGEHWLVSPGVEGGRVICLDPEVHNQAHEYPTPQHPIYWFPAGVGGKEWHIDGIIETMPIATGHVAPAPGAGRFALPGMAAPAAPVVGGKKTETQHRCIVS